METSDACRALGGEILATVCCANPWELKANSKPIPIATVEKRLFFCQKTFRLQSMGHHLRITWLIANYNRNKIGKRKHLDDGV